MRIRLQGSGHAARLLSELNRCRVSRLLCDVVLQVGGRSFPAHRAVLACSCGHFSGLLSGRAPPSTLALDFVSATTFEKVLTFIYTGEIFTDLIDVGVLYDLAERLGVSELVNACHATFPDLQSSGAAVCSSSATSCSSLSSSAPTPLAPSPQGRSVRSGRSHVAPASPKSEELRVSYEPLAGDKPSPSDALPGLALQLKTEQVEEGEVNGSAFASQESVPDSSAQLRGESCAPSSSSVDPLDSLQLAAVAGPIKESDFFPEEPVGKNHGSPEAPADVIELSDEEEEHFIVEEEDDEDLMCIENGDSHSRPCGSCGTLLPLDNGVIRAHAEAHLSDAGGCQVCGVSFPERGAAVAHALTHVGIHIFSCDVCEQQLRTESALVHHRRQSAAKSVLQSPEQLNSGSQRPGGELQCAICAKSISNDFKAVRDHLQTHACVRTLRCGVCQLSQASRCALLWHTLTHLFPLYTCPQCACPFLESVQLERHLSLHAEDGALGKPDDGGEGQAELRCFLCPQTFRSDAAFHYHLSTHSGDLQGQTWPSKRKAEQLLEFSSSSSSPLEAGGSGKAAFGVSLGFGLQDKLSPGGPFPAGLALNGGAGLREKLYRCRYCGKHFAHSGEFTYHLRIHTGEKPYQCKVCLRFFRGRSTMICHLKTHAGALMYRCTVCGLFFSTLKMVSSHMELHKDQLPDDFNIEETFMYNDHSKDPVPSLES